MTTSRTDNKTTARIAKAIAGLGLSLVLFGATAPTADARGDYQIVPEAERHEICILEGANICPPEELDIVFPCITTSLLAGEECPHHAESKDRPTEEVAFYYSK